MGGLNVFATAPGAPRFNDANGLQALCVQATGMLRDTQDTKRLATCLPKDFFQRPQWCPSRSPTPTQEDEERKTSLETVARRNREVVFKRNIELISRMTDSPFRMNTPEVPLTSRLGLPSPRKRAGSSSGGSARPAT